MQININSLIDHHLVATDGEIGKVKAFYFDDITWTIRYLVVETGSWLSGRKVLISPGAIIKDSGETGAFAVNLTKDQVSSSPSIDTDKPVSQQQELQLFKHYPWQNYWDGGLSAGGVWGILYPPASADNVIEKDTKFIDTPTDSNPHLRSTEAVTGYNIHATDGDIGHVKDFVMDDQTWKLQFFVVDTRNWFGGEKVLLSVSDIKEVQWDDSKVIINYTVDTVKNSRPFVASEFTYP